jgi:hypothetical protein
LSNQQEEYKNKECPTMACSRTAIPLRYIAAGDARRLKTIFFKTSKYSKNYGNQDKQQN